MRWVLLAIAFLAVGCSSVQVRMVPDEAEAVLAILDKRAAGASITDADWQRVFSSEGYTRLKKRELSMQRPFEDDAFRTFVLSDELLTKRDVLARTLASWLRADLDRAATLALAYLPPNAKIRAKIYPVIKPRPNSFVFEVETDPAIFKYIDDEPRERFETVIAHEMHHVGYGTACTTPEYDTQAARDIATWVGAFGEGIATLAAGGGPDRDAHRASAPDVHEAWLRELAAYDANFQRVEAFFLDVADGKVDDVQKRAFEFFGLLGPWYSVGWTMGATIEKKFGRDALVAVLCDPHALLGTYNRAAAGTDLPRWPERLIALLRHKRE